MMNIMTKALLDEAWQVARAACPDDRRGQHDLIKYYTDLEELPLVDMLGEHATWHARQGTRSGNTAKMLLAQFEVQRRILEGK